MALKVLTKKQTATVRRSPFLQKAKVISRRRKAAVALLVRTKGKKATVRRRSPFLQKAKVISRMRKATVALLVRTRRQKSTVRRRLPFLQKAKVISRLTKAAVALLVRTKRQKESKRTSLLVIATSVTSLTPLRNTAVATMTEANTAVTKASTVQVESARKWTK